MKKTNGRLSALRADQALTSADPDSLHEQAFLYSPYASVVINWEGQVLTCNRRAAQIWWKTEPDQLDRLFGTDFAQVISLEPDEARRRIQDSLASGTVELPMRFVPRPASRPNVALRACLLESRAPGDYRILLSQDVLIATANAISKINQQKEKARQAAATLSHKSAHLEESLKGAQIFTNAASHDLRGPLGSLSSLLALFDAKYSSSLPDNGQQYVLMMREAAQNLQDLTLCLLDHAGATSGKIDPQTVEVRDTLLQVRETLKDDLAAVGGVFDINVRPAEIRAEPLLFRNMLVNLVSNAIKHRATGRPVRISAELTYPRPEHLELVIQDNGKGFPPSKATAIFKPFERLDPSTPGSGIGLATCAEICRRHGWQISAEGYVNAGACFRINLPLDEPGQLR